MKSFAEKIFNEAVHSIEFGGDIVRLLLEYPNFNINSVMGTILPPLNSACEVGNIEVVRALLGTLKNEDESKRVKVNMQDFYKETALHVAVEEGFVDIVKLLLETLELDDVKSRVSFNLKNKEGKTAMDVVKKSNNHEMVQLFSKYVNVN